MTSATPPASQPTLWRTCRVLANRKRLQILALLIRQPNQTVSAVAERMSLSMPAASQYLRALEARGLLISRRVGRRVEYRPSPGTREGAAEEIVKALRVAFRQRVRPIEAIFKLATGFTHPRCWVTIQRPPLAVSERTPRGSLAYGALAAQTCLPTLDTAATRSRRGWRSGPFPTT